jgi:hypothetical protein
MIMALERKKENESVDLSVDAELRKNESRKEKKK